MFTAMGQTGQKGQINKLNEIGQFGKFDALDYNVTKWPNWTTVEFGKHATK